MTHPGLAKLACLHNLADSPDQIIWRMQLRSVSIGMPIQDVMRMRRNSDYKNMKPYMWISLKHLR
jgi:hypothetical protein